MRVKVTFPSGHIQWIEIPDANETGPRPERKTLPPRTNALKHACKHVREAQSAPAGCAGKQFSVWGCEVYGQCMPLAQFRPTLNGTMVCSYCPDYSPADDPSLLREIANYSSAMAQWIKKGMPVRSQERVNELFAICTACPFLRKEKGSTFCGKCGCPVSLDIMKPAKNKLAMATESCPLNPPRWAADV